ncbi:hypothetical protein GGR54DRAFT_630651 [Hypoxylon sp. NC1633]|nr:hypothetical protein GGR54DRAFT_630651 [Hypoxylon sp. NC1633]
MAIDELSRYLDDERFHQTFTLPSGPGRPEELKITYSDFGYRNPDEPQKERVLLFCGPLLGSRFLFIAKDKLAKKYGVRIINPDRPGFGGSTKVDASDRVRVWLETVPALLKHLGIEHVSIASQSAGSLYAMNTLLHLRHLLHPTHPYAALCVPWVHPSRSGVSLLKLANVMPDTLVGKLDRIVHFLQSSLGPALQVSSTFIPALQAEKDFFAPGVDAEEVEFEENLFPATIRRVNAESTQGLGADAVLLLKRKEHPEYWGSWVDYDGLVPLLAKAERELSTGSSGSPAPSPLKIDVFFAESDVMIGTGPALKWFDNCWRAEQRGDRIQYTSVVIPKTNHDNILDLRFGVPERVFQAMGSLRGD